MSPLRRENARTESARRRVVLLGASNLTRGLSAVLEAAHGACGRPLEVLAALGRGRSYGRSSRFFGRQLPGILQCGLWPALERSPGVPTTALVTDIGNDLLYEEPVEVIAQWVEYCVDRLQAIGARTAVTLLPVDNLHALSPGRYRLLRSVFFPRSRISLPQVERNARQLNDEVRRMAVARGISFVMQRAAWYGFDPIHIRRVHWAPAWREILGSWSIEPELPPLAPLSLARTVYLATCRPEYRRVLGWEERARQPSCRFADGTTLAIY